MAWPTHEDDFQSTCHPPPVSNVASESYIYIRFWYDNAGFGRLVQGVDKEDLWGLEKNPSERGNSMAWPTHEVHFRTAFHPPPMSNVAFDSTKKL